MSKKPICRLLRIDLSRESTGVELLSEADHRRYIGGASLACYHVLKDSTPNSDALSPDNVLCFAVSPLTGTAGPGFSRFTVAAKSPLTNAYGEAEAGGWWGPELRYAGYEGIIIRGRATKPKYIWINDGKCQLRDATHLWGLSTRDAQAAIRQEVGDDRARVALIGPAGENLVRYACILNELKHANGRCGMGAVMGSKNLKAIVTRGKSRDVPIWDPDTAQAIARDVHGRVPDFSDSFGTLGTTGNVEYLQLLNMLPTRNFSAGRFEDSSAISGETLLDTLMTGRATCAICGVRCKRVVSADEPWDIDPAYGGPEYETLAALGSLCGVGELAAIAKGHELCNALGLDTISTGNCIAFAMECSERALLPDDWAAGLDLRFGNAEVMLQLIQMIASREGLGHILADGVQRMAERLGPEAEAFAMHTKGQEWPTHEPRGKWGVALQYAVSPTGADHMEADHDPGFEERTPALQAVAPLGLVDTIPATDLGDGKVRMVVYLQLLYNVYNTLSICDFVASPIGPFSIAELVDYTRAVTGWDVSLWELMKVGERFGAMSRIFNYREGLTDADDRLPMRAFERLKESEVTLDQATLASALQAYYGMMGWDPEGRPTQAKLAELDISWAMEHTD
jgi:aldehyde:ferredoxin oxidoreductase